MATQPRDEDEMYSQQMRQRLDAGPDAEASTKNMILGTATGAVIGTIAGELTKRIVFGD